MYLIFKKWPVKPTLFIALSFVFLIAGTSFADIVYVKKSAVGQNTGESWVHAFTSVGAGIQAAQVGDEVWVAAGTYYPSSSLQMKNGVTIIGGLGGWEYPGIPDMRRHRNLSANQTILSGNGNKRVFHHPNTMSPALDATAVLDGFTITSGWGDGAGMLNQGKPGELCAPTLKNCIISGCSASSRGSGIYNDYAAPTLYNCQIINNNKRLITYGGGVYNVRSTPTFISCYIGSNMARFGGGTV